MFIFSGPVFVESRIRGTADLMLQIFARQMTKHEHRQLETAKKTTKRRKHIILIDFINMFALLCHKVIGQSLWMVIKWRWSPSFEINAALQSPEESNLKEKPRNKPDWRPEYCGVHSGDHPHEERKQERDQICCRHYLFQVRKKARTCVIFKYSVFEPLSCLSIDRWHHLY